MLRSVYTNNDFGGGCQATKLKKNPICMSLGVAQRRAKFCCFLSLRGNMQTFRCLAITCDGHLTPVGAVRRGQINSTCLHSIFSTFWHSTYNMLFDILSFYNMLLVIFGIIPTYNMLFDILVLYNMLLDI
jgi:hypothetical protein